MADNHSTFDKNGIPLRWYNIVADLTDRPHPPLNPVTRQPLKPEDLHDLFPKVPKIPIRWEI